MSIKRKALLIGNSNGLPGVKVDLDNSKKFLMSLDGGAWNEDEITVLNNPSRLRLLTKIECFKGKYDFMIVIFSGHGAYGRETILELNQDEELIQESQLIAIAPKQITIFDCCRARVQEPLFESRSTITFSDSGDSSVRYRVRKRYDLLISNAIDQQIRLYACSVGETALDTTNGGLYLSNLLSQARVFASEEEYKRVGRLHQIVSKGVEQQAWINELHRQHPDAVLPKCLSCQQLVFSINPLK